MNLTQNYKPHIFALSALFTIGNAIILLPGFNLLHLVLLPIISLLMLIFSFIIRNKCGKSDSAKRWFNITAGIAALFGALTSAVDYLHFLKVEQSTQSETMLLLIALLAAIVYLAKSVKSAIYKYSLFAFVIVVIIVALCFVAGIKNFDFENLKALDVATPDFKTYLCFFVPLFSLPLLVSQEQKCEKTICCGVALGVFILLIVTIQVFLSLGVRSQTQFSYLKTISIISIGSLFTRLDGLCWFVFFATTTLKCAMCTKIAVYSIKLLFVDIYKQKTL